MLPMKSFHNTVGLRGVRYRSIITAKCFHQALESPVEVRATIVGHYSVATKYACPISREGLCCLFCVSERDSFCLWPSSETMYTGDHVDLVMRRREALVGHHERGENALGSEKLPGVTLVCRRTSTLWHLSQARNHWRTLLLMLNHKNA